MTNLEYWTQREEAHLKQQEKDEEKITRKLRQSYNYLQDITSKQINGFYTKYAKAEGLSLADAKGKVKQADIDALKEKAKKYVKEKDFSPEANAELKLYNATMRINRLELLKADLGLEMIDAFNDIQATIDEGLTETAIKEYERQASILGETISGNAKRAKNIVNASFNNAKWSDRIWMYQSQLKSSLNDLLLEGLIQGKHPRELSKSLERLFGVSQANAERLMRTELARVQTDAQKDSFEEFGYDEFVFISLEGSPRTCSVCADLNGKHFSTNKMQPGLNAPPMHPNCRCSTAAFMSRGLVQSGGKETGGHYYKPDREDNERGKQAANAYDKFSRVDNAALISKNTGRDIKDIKIIQSHIFHEKHKLYDGYERFAYDYDMAVAWKRLIDGNYLSRDLILLDHELLESQIEKMYNTTVSEAHAKASEKYDWAERLSKETDGKGEPDGLL